VFGIASACERDAGFLKEALGLGETAREENRDCTATESLLLGIGPVDAQARRANANHDVAAGDFFFDGETQLANVEGPRRIEVVDDEGDDLAGVEKIFRDPRSESNDPCDDLR
jgi:hypothetical protein